MPYFTQPDNNFTPIRQYDDCAEVPALKDLEAKGFALSRRVDALAKGMTYYYITNEGVQAAIAYESKEPRK